MVHLEKFEQADFEKFKSWIPNQHELFQFAGPIFTYPVTDEQLTIYSTDEKRSAFKVVLTQTGEAIGHCELNFENPLPRLSRILIGEKSLRGKGIGKLIVNEMLKELFLKRSFESADLNVFDWNTGAIKCYEQAGLVINKDIVYRYNNNGHITTVLNFGISKEKWLLLKQ